MLEDYINEKISEARELMQNDTDKALKIYDELLEIEPDNINALNGKGSALMKVNKYDEANEYFDKSLSICENSSAFLNKGIIFKHLKENEQAIFYFDKACEINPNLENIITLLKNEITTSTDTINLNEFNDEASELIKKGIELKNESKLWDSLEAFLKAIEADSTCESEVNRLIDEIKNTFEKEFIYNDEEFDMDNKIDRIKMQAIRSLVKENDPSKTLTLMNIVLEVDKNDLNTLNHKGGVLFIFNEYQKAIDCFDKCLSIDKCYYCALFNKGIVLRIMNKLPEALSCFDELLKMPQYSNKVKPYHLEILTKLNQNPIP
ncbi:tetratricopeptide repeat protein [Methanobrevibacter millerae]|uniref:Tetratricopeptide repeat-containing protein n=1 Tax=Methanobrevibacter millerae TaxID=230361 RepID=A0A1G5VU60_9EURY|nr:tetratricopeptide repeat protein [Methanobrevibacter millerae]SDA48555.1 Tetratricopeptide repeat-containing protein [Methanobrevibacter millerae]